MPIKGTSTFNRIDFVIMLVTPFAPFWCNFPLILDVCQIWSQKKARAVLRALVLLRSQRVVHVELNGVSCHIQTLDLRAFEFDVAVDHVVSKYTTSG